MSNYRMQEGQFIEYNGERVVFAASDFNDIHSVTLEEIVSVVNSRATTYTASAEDGSLVIRPHDGSFDSSSLIQGHSPPSTSPWEGINWKTSKRQSLQTPE